MLCCLGDNTELCTLQELDYCTDFLTIGHLLLNLSDGIMRTGLAMEHKSIGIGDVRDDILCRSRRLEQLDIQSTIRHWVVGCHDKRRHILGYTHT